MVNMASIARRRRRSLSNSISFTEVVHTITYHISINWLFLNDSMVFSVGWQPLPRGPRGFPNFPNCCFSVKEFARSTSPNGIMNRRSYKWNSSSSHCYDLSSRDRNDDFHQEVIFLKDLCYSVPWYILLNCDLCVVFILEWVLLN